MSGGTVIINGPTDNGNGPVDYTGKFEITGGTFLAAGSSGMAMAPSASSGQPSVMVFLSSAQPAGTLVHIESSGGEEILTFSPMKLYQSVIFSSPLLVQGRDYVMYTGGSTTGTQKDGIYSGGTYTPGEKVAEFSLAGMVTTVGSAVNQRPGMMPGTMPNRMQGNQSTNFSGTMQGNRMNGMTVFRPGETGNLLSGNMSGRMAGYMPGAIPDQRGGIYPGDKTWHLPLRGNPGHFSEHNRDEKQECSRETCHPAALSRGIFRQYR